MNHPLHQFWMFLGKTPGNQASHGVRDKNDAMPALKLERVPAIVKYFPGPAQQVCRCVAIGKEPVVAHSKNRILKSGGRLQRCLLQANV
ncbi:hypothetical protein D3C85_1551690 [compost metagenome]